MDKIKLKINENKIAGKVIFKVKDQVFIVDERYEFIKLIGIGAQGIVVSAFDNITKTKTAIKKIPKAFEDLIDAKRIFREIKLLSFFEHENIVSLLDVQKPPARTGYEDIYLVTDLMETDLHRVIQSKQELTDEHIQQFVYQILRGVLQMHSCNVIHRDLKPSNLLLNKRCDLKICDFGLSRGFATDPKSLMTEYVVTRWQRAPEVILNAKRYNESLDVWSIGCILAELLGRKPLLPGTDQLEQVHRIIHLLGTPTNEDMAYIANESAKKYIKKMGKQEKKSLKNMFKKANPLCLNLLEKMLVFNPNKRLTVEECLNHQYFNELHNPDDEPRSKAPFDWSIDDFNPTKDLLQNKVYEESLRFHPETKQSKEINNTKLNNIINLNKNVKDIDDQLEAIYTKNINHRVKNSNSNIVQSNQINHVKERKQQTDNLSSQIKHDNIRKQSTNNFVAKQLLNSQGVYKNPYQHKYKK